MDKILTFVGKKTHLFILFGLTLSFNILLTLFMPKEYALDLKFAYSFTEALQSLQQMDLKTRELYEIGVWALDFPYLVVYSLFFAGVLYRLFDKKTFVFLPFGVALMDVFENILVLRILQNFPDLTQSLVFSASIFTTAKWVLVAIMMTLVIVGLVRMIILKKYSLQSQSEVEA